MTGVQTGALPILSGRLRLDDQQREGVEALTQAIVNKLLHAPLSHLRNEAESGAGVESLEAVRVLFALDDAAAPGAAADEALRAEMERSRLPEEAQSDANPDAFAQGEDSEP